MFSYIYSLNSDPGDILRIINGTIAIVAMGFMWKTAQHGPLERRSSSKHVAAIWGCIGLVLILGGLGIISSKFVPWMIHGLLILTSFYLIKAAVAGNKTWKQIEKAIKENLD